MAGRNFQAVADRASLERQFSEVRRRADRAEREDQLFDTERRLILLSPNGHFWAVTVNNAGALATVDLGTSL